MDKTQGEQTMKPTFLAALAALAASVLGAANQPQTFTGVITDTMCKTTHGMLAGQPDDKCIAMCVKGSSQFALYDGKDVLKLSDQKTPAKFAARRVKVIGTLNEKTHTIKVRSMELEGGSQ
jgi:hypothetical protein